jgi:hypothetical protein
MNDDEMLAATRSFLTSVKDSLTDVHMDRPPEAITARARTRRLRRSLPGVTAGGLALGVGLALTLSGGHPAGSGRPPAARTVHVNLAAWSVNTTSAGQVNVTIHELKDPARLSATLADAGIPVMLTSGRVCTNDDQAQLPRVLHKLGGSGDVVLTIDPAAMPAGTKLVIGIGTFRNGSEHFPAAAFGLIKNGSSLDCPGGAKTGVR